MTKENIDDNEILKNIAGSITQLDEQRLLELNNLKQLQEIKNEMFKLERNRLANKYGEDHPRVLKADSRLAYNQEMFPGLDKEIERANIKPDTLPVNSWRVHGKVKVYDEKFNPVKDVTVFLSDDKKTWFEALGNTCTDDSGYYSLTINEKQDDIIIKEPLFLNVSDKNQKLLYHDTEPLFFSVGLIDYKDIYLDGKDCVAPASNYEKDTSPPVAKTKRMKK
ncbi:MAG: hypothetical protein ABI723_10590 [Bacteroidia bacterium]